MVYRMGLTVLALEEATACEVLIRPPAVADSSTARHSSDCMKHSFLRFKISVQKDVRRQETSREFKHSQKMIRFNWFVVNWCCTVVSLSLNCLLRLEKICIISTDPGDDRLQILQIVHIRTHAANVYSIATITFNYLNNIKQLDNIRYIILSIYTHQSIQHIRTFIASMHVVCVYGLVFVHIGGIVMYTWL